METPNSDQAKRRIFDAVKDLNPESKPAIARGTSDDPGRTFGPGKSGGEGGSEEGEGGGKQSGKSPEQELEDALDGLEETEIQDGEGHGEKEEDEGFSEQTEEEEELPSGVNPFEETMPEGEGEGGPEAPEGKDEPKPKPAKEEEGDDVDIQALLEELEDLRKQNRTLRENGKDGLQVDGESWDAKRRAQEAEAENGALREMLQDAIQKQKELAEMAANTPGKGGQMQPEGERWKGRNVRMLMPWGKTTNPMTVASVAAFGMIYGRDKIGFIPAFGDSMIYNIRNHLADMFLQTDSEWSLWLDDDVIMPFGAAHLMRQFTGITSNEIPDQIFNVNGLERLMSHGKKLVGGVYFGRRKNSPPMFAKGMDDQGAYEAAKKMNGTLVPTDWVATGAMLVHREVYLDIRKKYPHLAPHPAREELRWGFSFSSESQGDGWVEDHGHIPADAQNVHASQNKIKVGERKNWQYFAPKPGKGEDVMFCERAKAAGHQPYADTGVVCLHVGTQPFGPHNTEYKVQQGASGGIRIS